MSAEATPNASEPLEQRGIFCPKCGCAHFRVIYTRRSHGGKIIRRRECRHCGRRVTTHESVRA